jgi:hypothetical protein
MQDAKRYGVKVLFLVLSIFWSGSIVSAGGFCPVSTTTDNYQYDPSWDFRWNPKNPDSIDPNLTLAVSVIGGKAPYTWTIERGNGFELDAGSTSGVTNHIRAGENACGAAWIIVIDKKGVKVKGSLRCKASGKWVLKETGICVMPGVPNMGNSRDYMVGGRWQYESPLVYYDVDLSPPLKCKKEENCKPAVHCVWCKRRKNPEVTGDLIRDCFSHGPCIYRMPGYGDDLWCAKNWQLFYYEWECPQ